ncbi:MAG: hypothetical protein VYD02_03515 [Pseudomonadota bacterium]|nr:hypothetical protein [Pseudomonadota bacterium]
MKLIFFLLNLFLTGNVFADVTGLICSGKQNLSLFYLIDVDREKVKYTNQLRENWSSTKLIESSLVYLKWKEGSIPVWKVSIHRETLKMAKTESSGKILDYACKVNSSDETIEGHEKAKEEQRQKNKI